MQIKGIITKALAEQSGTSKSGKAWRKREYVVEYESGQYPKSVVFSVMGQKIEELNIQQGQEYELSIDFEAREWNGRYFLQASCWKAYPTLQQTEQPNGPQPAETSAQPVFEAPKDNMGDDLPF